MDNGPGGYVMAGIGLLALLKQLTSFGSSGEAGNNARVGGIESAGVCDLWITETEGQQDAPRRSSRSGQLTASRRLTV